MSFFKKIDKGVAKAEKKYHEVERDTRNIRKTGMKIVDYIIPPPKKKGKSVSMSGKKVKIGDCTCTCPKKKKGKGRR